MKRSSLRSLSTVVAILGMAAPAFAQAPTWAVELETRSGWTGPSRIIVDSTGDAVTFDETQGLKMPRCAKLDEAELARVAKRIAWLMKNVKVDEGESYGHCLDDPRVKVFIQSGEQVLPLGYPLEQSCRDFEPPSALRQLVDQLLELRAKSLARCGPMPAR